MQQRYKPDHYHHTGLLNTFFINADKSGARQLTAGQPAKGAIVHELKLPFLCFSAALHNPGRLFAACMAGVCCLFPVQSRKALTLQPA